MSTTPFVIGQWVRGENFYGRTELINTILRGNRNCLWILGTRRIGKTSLLKQVEMLATNNAEYGYFPLFWDFQGAETPSDLHEGFGDALLDAEDRLDELGISPDEVESDDLFKSLGQLRRKLTPKNLRLLLLCDEVEELIGLDQKDPTLLRRLRRAMQSREDIRTVMASRIGLWALSEQRGNTSPFLLGFTPALYIHNLADDEAEALIRQVNLSSESRPRFDDVTVETVRAHCNNHPYLIQLLCERYLAIENLEQAIEEVATDPMVSFFFATDFEMLTDEERNILRVVAEPEGSSSNSIRQHLNLDDSAVTGALHRLEHLGYIRRAENRRFDLANYFFRRWFSGSSSQSRPTPSIAVPIDASAEQTVVDPVSLGVFDSRYDLVERVGKGATGMVYKAFDKTLRSHIAIKVLNTEYARDDEAMERVRREILLSRDLSHPNVVRIYHLGEWEGQHYLTMPWMDGPTLGQLIANQAPFADERTIAFSRKLASALDAAHSRKILHRDIKPDNILTDEEGEPYLTDFGLARVHGDQGMTSQGVFLGTPNYASPEQAQLLPIDHRSDLYSLGLVMFEMATGQRPFTASTTAEILRMHRSATAPAPRDLRPAMNSELSGLILQCLAKDPEKRIQSARRLQRSLERIGSGKKTKRRWFNWGRGSSDG